MPLTPAYIRLTARFWSKAKISGDQDCWLWTGGLSRGYGRFGLGNAVVWAHRLAYELTRGPITPGMTIDHLCAVTACVNPWHMEVVTAEENARRANARRRGTAETCRHGHPWDAQNTYIEPSTGARQCKTCRRARQIAYNARKRPWARDPARTAGMSW